jgi:hypothetical protein
MKPTVTEEELEVEATDAVGIDNTECSLDGQGFISSQVL